MHHLNSCSVCDHTRMTLDYTSAMLSTAKSPPPCRHREDSVQNSGCYVAKSHIEKFARHELAQPSDLPEHLSPETCAVSACRLTCRRCGSCTLDLITDGRRRPAARTALCSRAALYRVRDPRDNLSWTLTSAARILTQLNGCDPSSLKRFRSGSWERYGRRGQSHAGLLPGASAAPQVQCAYVTLHTCCIRIDSTRLVNNPGVTWDCTISVVLDGPSCGLR
jgi:hypothetical protein